MKSISCSTKLIPLLVLLSEGALLRHHAEPDAGLADKSVAEIKQDVKEKWGQMDEFLEAMFMLACKWKHGKDVHGAAAEKLQDGSLKAGQPLEDFMSKQQKANLQGLSQACGTIVASQEGKCRQGCSARWNAKMEKRSECDKSCVVAYSNFEKSCNQKAEHLERVYAMKLSARTARKRCYEGHCPEFPTVWMMADVEKMADEVDERCGSRCEEDQVKMRCTHKWQLEVDFIKTSVGAKCAEDATAVKCYNDKKDGISQEQSNCASDGKETCQAQLDECKTKGNVESSPKEASEACASRLKLCETQVTSRCLDDHKSNLESARKACETDDSKTFKQCKEDALQKRMEDSIDACTKDRLPKCDEECHQTCKVDDMNGCLDNLKSEGDATEDFCVDFWELLHDSSEVDPVTGAPIVLLVSKKPAVVVVAAQPPTANRTTLHATPSAAVVPPAPTAAPASKPAKGTAAAPLLASKAAARVNKPEDALKQVVATPLSNPKKINAAPHKLKAIAQAPPLVHKSAPVGAIKSHPHTVKIEFQVPFSENWTEFMVDTLTERTGKLGIPMPAPGDNRLVVRDIHGTRSDPSVDAEPSENRFPLHVVYKVRMHEEPAPPATR